MEKELLIVHKRYFQNYKLLLLPLCNVVWHSKLLQSSWPITLERLFLWGPALQPCGRVDLSEQNLVSTTVPCVSLNSLQHSHAWWRLCVCGCWLSAHRLLNLRTRNVIASLQWAPVPMKDDLVNTGGWCFHAHSQTCVLVMTILGTCPLCDIIQVGE